MDVKEAVDDKIRREQSYKYLCYVEEIRLWIQSVLKVKMPSGVDFEEKLRNGVILAKFAHFISPELAPLTKIYDMDESLYNKRGLCFKHTENINLFMDVLNTIRLPITISLETTDIYNKNNIPKVVCCLHMLITYLHKKKNTKKIDSLAGKITFTDEDIKIVNNQLKKHGNQLFPFDAPRRQADENKENLDTEKDACMARLNKALETESQQHFIDALRHPSLGIDKAKLNPIYIPLYFMELREDKISQGDILFDGIKQSINVLHSIAEISDAVDTMSVDTTWIALNSSLVPFMDLNPDFKAKYLKALQSCKRYINIERCECTILSYMNIQHCIDLVNENETSIGLMHHENNDDPQPDSDDELSNEPTPLSDLETEAEMAFNENLDQRITNFQAYCRGYLVRQRMATIKPVETTDLDFHFKRDPVVIIQAAWRGFKVRKLFKSILSGEDVTFKNLRAFLLLFDMGTTDYEKEIHLQAMRGQVVQSIRKNSELLEQINKMDINIGLLVQNRISLMDAVEETKKIGVGVNGLKSLRAESRRILEGYQHLFYTLQTCPNYLAKLIFCMPQNKSSKFLQSVIFSLYNFGANPRNEYLMLKLFQRALHEEIRCKFTSPSDVITGNPLVLKMVVNYARLTGRNALKHILGSLLDKVLINTRLMIETNPILIYSFWRNETEMKSGKSFESPHSVSYDVALSHEEVVKRLGNALVLLKKNVEMFLKRIVKLKDCLPYGLRYIARELKSGLLAKFPDTPQKEIVKVVGNMLYYQFVNSAIVAPDALDIISLPAGKTLTSNERHALANIAKILQFAAAKKGFGEEARHLMCLNPFIIECHEIFKKYFLECCDVEDLDTHFSINEFSEATLITCPSIYISLQEIVEIHSLLKDHEYEIAPEPTDPLRELLKDLDPIPTLSQLSGYGESDYNEGQIAKTEVAILLKNKFERCAADNTDLSKLFVRTKELLVNVFPYLSGHTLLGSLRIESRNEEAQMFEIRHPGQGTLKECKAKLRKNLKQLDEQSVVNKDNGYQSILNAVGADICNKNKYRKQQLKDLQSLKETLTSLNEKTVYYQDQISFYQKYIETCLENLNSGKKNIHCVRKNNPNEKFNTKHTLKYTGAKLYEKGILISIEGLPASQFKNVQFEICPSDTNGIFNVTGKFMGVEVENVEIDMQNLLQLQYNGIGVKNIFGKAKININLLLYLLNGKYYKKS